MPLKLIGAGLGRTGTMSLKVALEQIGYGPCYHMAEVMANPKATSLWVTAANGKPDWEAIFKGYVATVDYPGCSFWRELSVAYPAAKVLLSLRDPDKWFESTQETIFSDKISTMLKQSPMKEFFEKTVWKEFGSRISERKFMVEAFKRHNEEVQRTIPKERLLVFEASQGWEPLCKFLGVPVPATPFPRTNSREELAGVINAAANAGGGIDDFQSKAREHMQKARERS
ncbi:MAG: sulfotransferase family protein [Alphaproteobacteria bacterium]